MRRTLILLCLLAFSIRIAAAATVTGKVVSPDGKPIAGASLFMYLFTAQQRQELTTDADGRFAVEADLTQRQTNTSVASLSIYAPGYALASVILEDKDNLITLAPGGRISGTVVDAEGKPLAGVPVRLLYMQDNAERASPPEEWQAKFTVVSAVDGTWTLPGIRQSGTVTLALDGNDYVHEQRQVKLIPGEKTAVQFTTRPGAVVTGRVLAPDGTPAANARVVAFTENHSQGATYSMGRTGTDGRYRLGGLATGAYLIGTASEKQDWIAEPLKDIALVEGKETAAPDLQTRVGALLEGTVVDAETGATIPGANVMINAKTTDNSQPRQYGQRTDKDGHFRLRQLPAPVTLRIENPPRGYLKQMDTEAVTADLQEGKTVTVVLKLHPGLTITGHVNDQAGKPAVGVKFFIQMPCGKCDGWCRNDTQVNFTTDARGDFEAAGLPAGKGTLNLVTEYEKPIEWDMLTPLNIEVPAKTPVAVSVTRIVQKTLTGRVLDTKGQPLAGVTAVLNVRFGRFGEGKTLTVITGENGTYQLANIAADTKVFLISLHKEGYRQRIDGTLKNKETTMPDAVMVACNASVHGMVGDGHGQPVAGVTVVSAETGLTVRATTDAAGLFTLPSQPDEGELHLVAATPSGGGLAVCQGNAQDVVIICTAGTTAKPTDLQLAEALLDADSQRPREQRLFNRADTLRAIADCDFEMATRLAIAGDEPAPAGLRAYLLGKLAAQDPANADKFGAAVLEMIEDDQCKLYGAVELGVAMVKTDPALAEQCYGIAKAIYDRSAHNGRGYKPIDGLGTYGDISLRIFALAGLLQKTDDVTAMLAPLNMEIKKDDGMSYMILQPLMEAAGRVSPEFVFKIYDGIQSRFKSGNLNLALSSMAKCNPAGAQRLLEMMNARKADYEGMSATGPIYIIDTLGKTDPAAALALAKTDGRPDSLLEAAAFLPKDQARALLQPLFADVQNQTIMKVAKVNAIDPELGKELYAKYKKQLEAESYNFTNRYNEDGSSSADRVQYAYLISSLDPVEARLILETEYALAQRKVQKEENDFVLQYFPQAMCPLDLNRAQEMLFTICEKNKSLRPFLQQRMMQYILMPREERVGASFF